MKIARFRSAAGTVAGISVSQRFKSGLSLRSASTLARMGGSSRLYATKATTMWPLAFQASAELGPRRINRQHPAASSRLLNMQTPHSQSRQDHLSDRINEAVGVLEHADATLEPDLRGERLRCHARARRRMRR